MAHILLCGHRRPFPTALS